MKLAAIADAVARDIYTRPINPWRGTYEAIRDACDIATGSDLAPRLLDRLTDMVEARVQNPTRYAVTRTILYGPPVKLAPAYPPTHGTYEDCVYGHYCCAVTRGGRCSDELPHRD